MSGSTRSTRAAAKPASLTARLLEYQREAEPVAKRGRNDHHGYDYAKGDDVVAELGAALNAQGLVLIPTGAGNVRHEGVLTTVDLRYVLSCPETGETLDIVWTGTGFDKGGDKGLYKALTGARKYLLFHLALVGTGDDDPEADKTTGGGNGGRNADVPRIPKGRAERIVKAAIAAGLAEWPEGAEAPELDTVLRAKLAEVGASKVGALNVDQAEAVESFIDAEASKQTTKGD